LKRRKRAASIKGLLLERQRRDETVARYEKTLATGLEDTARNRAQRRHKPNKRRRQSR